jgi:hypothetical protein
MDRHLKAEAVVNNIVNVKIEVLHKHSIIGTTKTAADVFQRRFFETDLKAKQWLN